MVRSRQVHRCWLVVALASSSSMAYAQDQADATIETPSIEVVGTTPLSILGTPLDQVPSNVQRSNSSEIARQQSRELGAFLNRNIGDINLNTAQNNPFQPDVTFRGFMASPLLGNPEGLSVFQDGVRINEPFGDVVNWDLIPASAISSIQLIPGSNPVFGLNTLGGALSVSTKSGLEYPGLRANVGGGSFGRTSEEIEAGGREGRADYFVTGNHVDDHGWASHNPSRIDQVFGAIGHQGGKTRIDASFTGADNRMEGNQMLPRSFLDDPKQAYTFPDVSENRLGFVNIKLAHVLSSTHLFAANAYYRDYRNDGFNSNVNNDFDPTLPIGPGNPQATNDTTRIDTTSYGSSAQWTSLKQLGVRENQLTIGAGADRGDTNFSSSSQPANFNADRGTVPAGPFALVTAARATNVYYGLYATDTLSLTKALHLTVSGRANQARVEIHDRTGATPALNGAHTFSRLNPAAGFTYTARPGLNTYLGYSEGMRAPTPVELTCADPSTPCKLPNAFLADPPLQPVVSRTWEAGLRHQATPSWRWNASIYRTDLRDDIQFVSSGTLSSGFFRNVGDTRRQGVEFGVQTKIRNLITTAAYGYVDATFQSPFLVRSPSNSSADANGNITVRPGDRIPGIPVQTLKLRLDYTFSPKLAGAATWLFASGQYARGDENNADKNGKVPGYGVVSLDGRYHLSRLWTIYGKVDNLFDRRYETSAVLGQNFFNGPGRTFDANAVTNEQFRAVAAPRGIWIGIEYREL